MADSGGERACPQGARDMQAADMTIVGGRPPGSASTEPSFAQAKPGGGRALGAVPRGIEVLVKKANVDPAFRQTLLAKRSGAAGEIGLLLDPAEALMLNAVPAEHLDAIIAGTKVEPSKVPIFLGKVAAAMLLTLGAMYMDGCATKGHDAISRGIRPEVTAPADQPATAPTTPR